MIKLTNFVMGRDSKIAPKIAIFQFPDEQINQLHNKVISSQPSNYSALSKANGNVHDRSYIFHNAMKLASPMMKVIKITKAEFYKSPRLD